MSSVSWWRRRSTPATKASKIAAGAAAEPGRIRDRGDALVALDAVGAGVGDTVLVATDGYAAFTSVGKSSSPIDMAVIGVIDKIDLLLDFDAAPAPAALDSSPPPAADPGPA